MLNMLAYDLAHSACRKGFDRATWDDPVGVMAKLMLAVTELAEAAEAIRVADHENFGEELADVVIRVLALSADCEVDIDAHIARKRAKNETREHKHGKIL